jgi:lipopolysaccharide biosynthesis regulator YciM
VLGALQSGRRSGLRLLSLLKHEEIIAKARVYAMDIVEQDPTLSAHDGLAVLVGQTVGDEERAAWLDRAVTVRSRVGERARRARQSAGQRPGRGRGASGDRAAGALRARPAHVRRRSMTRPTLEA